MTVGHARGAVTKTVAGAGRGEHGRVDGGICSPNSNRYRRISLGRGGEALNLGRDYCRCRLVVEKEELLRVAAFVCCPVYTCIASIPSVALYVTSRNVTMLCELPSILGIVPLIWSLDIR
jgi:hypothetical protein